MGVLLAGRYEILEVLGEGGEGRVVKARDVMHDRVVAIKVSPLSGDAMPSEGRILLSMSPHPGITVAREDFLEDGAYHLVTDWIDGRDLGRVLVEEGNPGLEMRKVVTWLAQAAEALDHIHSCSPPVVHGDVKPANLVLTDDGRVVLVDFGVSTRQGPLARGTEHFVAPEVSAGLRPTPLSDVYALAATAFTLLTGRLPTGSADFRELGIERIESSILKALSIDPAGRPDSAGEFAESLRAKIEPAMPTGIVTFLLTDVAGSTRLWDQHPADMATAMDLFQELVFELVVRHEGGFPKDQGEGDSAVIAFHEPLAAIRCALDMQRQMLRVAWPPEATLRVRIGLHSGETQFRGGNYHGVAIIRSARIRSLAQPGQILLSRATAEMAGGLPEGASLRSLGTHALKGLSRPEEIMQLGHIDIPDTFPLVASAVSAGNLPVAVTRFVGRREETESLLSLVQDSRLVTVMGPGGIGKTRLTLEVASVLPSAFPDGISYVELAPLVDGDEVAGAVAQVLGVEEVAGGRWIDSVIDHLRQKTALVILDNCEHVIDGAASTIEALIGRCANTKVLATSREIINVAGEAVLRLDPLSLDPPSSSNEAADAVALFIDRFGGTRPELVENLDLARQICSRLDGIPLAIELAAGGARETGLAEFVERLDDRLSVIAGGPRTAAARQKTLRALIDWSYELLSGAEKTLLGRLAVFPGGFTVGAASQVCGDDDLPVGEIPEMVTALRDKSLLQEVDAPGARRFRFLDTIREYSLEKLSASGAQARLKDFHLAWFAGRASDDTSLDVTTLELDRHNLSAAARWAIETGRFDLGLKLVPAIYELWGTLGPLGEGRSWIDAFLDASNDAAPEARAEALLFSGVMAQRQGELAPARARFEQLLRVQRSRGDRSGIVKAQHLAGGISLWRGEFSQAREQCEESLWGAKELGETILYIENLKRLAEVGEARGNIKVALDLLVEANGFHGESEEGRAEILSAIAGCRAWMGELREALDLHSRALERARYAEPGRPLAICLLGMGKTLSALGRYGDARSAFEEAKGLGDGLEDRWLIAEAACALGELAVIVQESERALVDLRQADSIWRRVGAVSKLPATLIWLGAASAALGSVDEAVRVLQDSVTMARSIDARADVALAAEELGNVEYARGNFDRAAARHREALALRSKMDFRPGMVVSAEGLASCLLAVDDLDGAVFLWGAASREREQMGLAVSPREEVAFQSIEAAIMGGQLLETTLAEGARVGVRSAMEHLARRRQS